MMLTEKPMSPEVFEDRLWNEYHNTVVDSDAIAGCLAQIAITAVLDWLTAEAKQHHVIAPSRVNFREQATGRALLAIFEDSDETHARLGVLLDLWPPYETWRDHQMDRPYCAADCHATGCADEPEGLMG